ncbi:uncharacterized protein EHS24_000453 [Apiotrichum porosum]|uniref:Uncharacterized protein n=1 Tax=Apiotrichum porosum TaxID=105984 RepID=A0A427Y9U6_9TREE|nr:uncharacterized protein EHS24_000453 [Apiotrichum porosum]RSH87931.1 hypothetical protein EHS24_000453 [Apiotrichum porosum]
MQTPRPSLDPIDLSGLKVPKVELVSDDSDSEHPPPAPRTSTGQTYQVDDDGFIDHHRVALSPQKLSLIGPIIDQCRVTYNVQASVARSQLNETSTKRKRLQKELEKVTAEEDRLKKKVKKAIEDYNNNVSDLIGVAKRLK